jgi:hypothetical protein
MKSKMLDRHKIAKFLACLMLAMLVSAAVPTTSGAVQSSDTPVAPLDARIGGTVDSFETQYGETLNEPGTEPDSVRNYKNKNYRNLHSYALDGYVYSVGFSSDLPTTPAKDSKTWTVKRATQFAKRFLPDDVECGEAESIDKDRALRTQCTSVALTAVMFPADYQRVEQAGDSGTVSFMLFLDKKGGSKVTDLEAAIGTMSRDEAGITPPTDTPVDTYNVSGPATPAEIQYFRQVQVIIAQMLGPNNEMIRIVNDQDFATDPSLWFELVEVMRPFHSAYTQWQALSAPTARLESFHQATTDALYNFDQAATNIDIGVNNFDLVYINMAAENMTSASDALDRAMNLMSTWESAADFDISEDL